MDSRVTAENHPDDPFGMGTGPTYADRSFRLNQEVIARHNLRPDSQGSTWGICNNTIVVIIIRKGICNNNTRPPQKNRGQVAYGTKVWQLLHEFLILYDIFSRFL